MAKGISLPEGFDGSYAPAGEACAGATMITVADGTMMDGAMTVTDLIEDPVNPNRVDTQIEISAGGETVIDAATITLSDDRQRLDFVYADGSVITWNRCP